jgi:hypothetical protein
MKLKYLFALTIISINLLAYEDATKCAEIKSDKQRLKCYDSFFINSVDDQKINKSNSSNIKPKPKQNEKLESKTVKKTKTDNFGLNQAQIEKRNKTSITNAISSKIIKSTKLFSGKYRFYLENDQSWESFTALAPNQYSAFKKNRMVIIEKANFGGYWLIDNKTNKKIKVKRID